MIAKIENMRGQQQFLRVPDNIENPLIHDGRVWFIVEIFTDEKTCGRECCGEFTTPAPIETSAGV